MKRQSKLLKSGLLFKKIPNFKGKLLQNYRQLECGIFRILFETPKRSFISAFSICMTVPLISLMLYESSTPNLWLQNQKDIMHQRHFLNNINYTVERCLAEKKVLVSSLLIIKLLTVAAVIFSAMMRVPQIVFHAKTIAKTVETLS